MTSWHEPLHTLDHRRRGWTCRERVTEVLGGEMVEALTASAVKDVCDEGHVHTDITLGLLTASRVLHVVAGDAHHVTDEHDLGLRCAITSVPLRAVADIAVLAWDDADQPALEVRVARAGGAWQAVGDLHDCGDPGCDIPPGSIQLEGQPDGVVFIAHGPDVAALAAFAGRLARAVAVG